MKNKILKPFDLQDALVGKAVMMRNGEKAYVRHHETELNVSSCHRLLGYGVGGEHLTWCENGEFIGTTPALASDNDIIGMYPETRMINGFEVPAPETEELEYGTSYYLASSEAKQFHNRKTWSDHDMDKLWLERGLVFLCAEDAVANTKAMMGIDPNGGDK